ncbi:MAG: glycosyltransferase family 39 protein [Chloroflexota bacterium]
MSSTHGVLRVPRPSSATLAVGAVTLIVAGLLAAQIWMDPNIEVTRSDSPFTDEGWSVMGARNVVLLGRWITDEWELVIAQLPFNAAALAAFELFGVGIIQARVVSLLAAVAAVGILGLLVGRRFGLGAGAFAALALGMAPLLLFYGRLALLEPMMTAALVAGFAALLADARRGAWWPGLLAGVAQAIAMGTKPSAAAAIVGMLAGSLVAAGAGRQLILRRWGIVAAVLVACGLAWGVGVTLAGISIPRALRPWPETGFLSPVDVLATRAWEYVNGANDNAVQLTATLIVGAALGLMVLWTVRRSLGQPQRLVVGAALGWALVEIVVILLADYRPNRYALPVLPPLALLTGVGGGTLLTAARRARPVNAVLALALVVAIAAAGVASLQRWFSIATYRLPAIQQELADLLPPGAVVQGWFAPTLAMRAPVTTIVAQGEVNRGDTYQRLGVRWLLLERRGEPVDWLELHRDAWANRRWLGCWTWQRGEICLDQLP